MPRFVVNSNRSSIPYLPLNELKSELDALEHGSIDCLSDEELQSRLRVIHTGLRSQSPFCDPGNFIYRARRVVERPSTVASISYPPSQYASIGRANRKGEAMFYGSLRCIPCLQECGAAPGDFFVISIWEVRRQILLAHLGFTGEVMKLAPAPRSLPKYTVYDQDTERNDLIRRWQARLFTRPVLPGAEQQYRVTIALRDIMMSNIVAGGAPVGLSTAGILYPSVATELLATNIALLPSVVDSDLELKEAILLVIDSTDRPHRPDGHVTVTLCDDVAVPDASGSLVWGQKSALIILKEFPEYYSS